jgi:hypothetical protein
MPTEISRDASPGLPRASRQLLQLSFAIPRPCPWGPSCICLNHLERRAIRRVGKIVRQWKRQVRREVRREEREARRVLEAQAQEPRPADRG